MYICICRAVYRIRGWGGGGQNELPKIWGGGNAIWECIGVQRLGVGVGVLYVVSNTMYVQFKGVKGSVTVVLRKKN